MLSQISCAELIELEALQEHEPLTDRDRLDLLMIAKGFKPEVVRYDPELEDRPAMTEADARKMFFAIVAATGGKRSDAERT